MLEGSCPREVFERNMTALLLLVCPGPSPCHLSRGGGVDLTSSNSLFFRCFSGAGDQICGVEEGTSGLRRVRLAPDLSWVAPEPRDFASDFSTDSSNAWNEIEDLDEGIEGSWVVQIPGPGRRICSSYSSTRFPMYEFAFREAGFRLPFTGFQTGVFTWLNLAPSQLHPNALAFMRAFEIVCRYLDIGATLSLFFRIFHLQRQMVGDKCAWVSFKQSGKLFRPYLDSVRDFKKRFYVIKLVTREAEDTLFERTVVVNEEGKEVERIWAKFPLEWDKKHYERGPDFYSVKPEKMERDDQLSYERLENFVKSFRPAICVDREGNVLLDSSGEIEIARRYIHTKALLDCESRST